MTPIDLKSIVSKQIPEFAREDYPLFVAFVEAYYEYLDTYEKRNLTSIRDIDETLDEYVQYFKNELDVFGENYDYADLRLMLRKIKQVSVAKGVESSYKFLFKLLYNKQAEISYPWDVVLKASDGKWNQEMSVFLDTTAGDVNILPGQRINIVGDNVVIKVFVERVRYVRDNIYEVFINKDYYGNIKVGYTVNYGAVSGTIIPTTTSYNITRSGSGYKVGDLITGITVSNGIKIEQLLKVTKVDENGGIMRISTIRYGCGYDAGFYLLKSNAIVANSSLLTIDKNTTRQYSLINDTFIEKYTDYGYAINPNYNEVLYDDPSYAGTLLQQFYEDSLSSQGEDPDYLLIRFEIGAVAKYPGHFSSSDGFLDDDIVLQDSYRYQKYSYLITVDEKLDKYKSLIKSYLHPAGVALFGEYQIQNTYETGVTASLELGQWRGKATFRTINKTIDRGNVIYPTDIGGFIMIDPYDSELYFRPEVRYNPPIAYPFFGDSRNVLNSIITISDAITVTKL